MSRAICVAAFVVGLTAVVWVGAGYVGSSALALTMTALIAAVYVTGAVELLRFHRDTAALARALAAIPESLSHPDEWLGRLPPSLQNPVRLRIEGERVGLPGPALTPYLVGLLVLLGMLGTFLGLVVTLNGVVIALESTTDLQAIRAALAAPVKGLGVAFGTSVAGVAASAMLGLVSALCRNARLQAARLLDGKIATALRGFSAARQREETLEALQRQAKALPEVVAALQATMERMGGQSRELNERLLGEQERFYRDARSLYAELADSVGRSLKESASESARLAGETMQPVVAATMAGIARETTALQERVTGAVERQLDGVSTRFQESVARVADTWSAALARHERTGEALSRQLQEAQAAYADAFQQRTAALLASVEGTHAALRADLAATTSAMAQETRALHAELTGSVRAQLEGLAQGFGTAAGTVSDTWTAALAGHARANEELSARMHGALEAFAGTFAQRSAALIGTIAETAAAVQAESASRDEARQAALARTLESMAASLQQEWQQAGARALAQQEQLCKRLDETARDVAESARAQAGSTIDEVARLMQTAAEAPRAAAEVVAELRQALSASLARDNESLAERSRIMETLGALLAAINRASTEQREAIDALVASSAALLARAQAGFAERIEAESSRMAQAAGEVAGGAAEVASLGEAFGLAVQLFSESNDKLMGTLQRIEGALAKSAARSDEQLAYYVAQARELIDLVIMSQRQVLEDLSGRQASLAGEV